MITSKAIIGLFGTIRELFSDFPLVPVFVYDNNLDFEQVGTQYIAREDLFQKIPESDTNDWVILMWKRTVIKPIAFQNRPIYSVNYNEILKKYKFKMATTTISLSFFCSDVMLGEDLEEFMVLNIPENLEFEYEIDNLGSFKGTAKLNADYTYEKLDTKTLGSIMVVNLDVDLSYFVFGNEEDCSIIEQIPLMIMDENGNLISEDLIS